jgi:hypothetical protein
VNPGHFNFRERILIFDIIKNYVGHLTRKEYVMCVCKKVFYEVTIEGYLIEVITGADCNSADLWIGKKETNIKMKFSQIKLRSNEKELKPLLQELIQENFEMAVFNYNELIKISRSAGLIEYVNEMEGAC